jgi:hypothetical protein
VTVKYTLVAKDLDITDKIWLYTIKNLKDFEALGNVLELKKQFQTENNPTIKTSMISLILP